MGGTPFAEDPNSSLTRLSCLCRKIKDGQLDERERYGLPQDVLMWVYGLGRPWTAKR